MRPAVLLVFAAIQSLLGGWVWEIYFWPLATVQLLRCNSSLCPCAFLFSHLPSKHLPFSSPFFFSSFPSFNAVTLQTEKGLLVIHKMVGCWHKQHRQWQGKSARVCAYVCVVCHRNRSNDKNESRYEAMVCMFFKGREHNFIKLE